METQGYQRVKLFWKKNRKKVFEKHCRWPKNEYFWRGELPEWSNGPVLKTGVLHGTGGSNPSFSASKLRWKSELFFVLHISGFELSFLQLIELSFGLSLRERCSLFSFSAQSSDENLGFFCAPYFGIRTILPSLYWTDVQSSVFKSFAFSSHSPLQSSDENLGFFCVCRPKIGWHT